MSVISKTTASICLFVAAGLMTALAANAQTTSNQLPPAPFAQPVPLPEQLKKYSAPAMSLADIPPTPAEAAGLVPRLTVRHPGGVAHIMDTVAGVAARKAAAAKQAIPLAAPPVLMYHGGPIMYPYIQIYTIFWGPPRLQNGSGTAFSAKYGQINHYLAAFFGGHALQNIATQYYQTAGSTTTYVQNAGYAAGYYLDTSPYPASGCTDSHTPGNCVTDAQIRAEIAKVMSINGWTGGINKIFILFTSWREGSCFDSSSTSCAYTQYCAYHSFFMQGSTPVIYANQPYADTSTCHISGQTWPNGDDGDLAANTASHEISESITDPLLNAWFDNSGNEIGDLCNFVFGTNTWPGPSAPGNQMWNGVVFELQQEWDNNAGACASAGPQ
jgi:hypothetical protein